MKSLLILIAALPASAGQLTLASSSKLWLEGDSTLHKFSAEAKELKLSGASQDAASAAWLKPGSVSGLTVTVPVAALRSKDKKLDKNMHAALKAGEHPNITFVLSSYAVDGKAVTAKGALTIAGQSRDVDLAGEAEPAGAGLRVRGEEPLKMTDFGIKPPAMMMGAIKTKDDVVVKFDITLEGENK